MRKIAGKKKKKKKRTTALHSEASILSDVQEFPGYEESNVQSRQDESNMRFNPDRNEWVYVEEE